MSATDVPAGAAQPDALGAEEVREIRDRYAFRAGGASEKVAALAASHELLRARLAGQSDPATLRAGLEAIKADMSREAFVPWAEGMLAALDSTQAALEAVEAQLAAAEQDRDEARLRLSTVLQEINEVHGPSTDRQLIRELRFANQSLVARIHELDEITSAARAALDDPDLLHWLGSCDVLDVSAAVARAASAIHALRAALASSAPDRDETK